MVHGSVDPSLYAEAAGDRSSLRHHSPAALPRFTVRDGLLQRHPRQTVRMTKGMTPECLETRSWQCVGVRDGAVHSSTGRQRAFVTPTDTLARVRAAAGAHTGPVHDPRRGDSAERLPPDGRELPATWTVAFDRDKIQQRTRQRITLDLGCHPSHFNITREAPRLHIERRADYREN